MSKPKALPHDRDCDDPDTCELGSCDCCNREVPRCWISKVDAYGIETYACPRCRGEEEPTNANS